MVKKIITIILVIVVMSASVGVPVFADSNEPSAWAKATVEEAIKLGFVPEKLQGDYQKAITREEFASLFVTTIFAYQKLQYPNTEGTQIKNFTQYYAVTKEDVLRQVNVTDEAKGTVLFASISILWYNITGVVKRCQDNREKKVQQVIITL